VRADRVLMPPPGFDQHPRFGEGEEDLTIEQFVALRPVEALVVAILPRRRRRNAEGLHTNLRQPFLGRRWDKLGAIIGPHIVWRPTRDEQIRKCRQHVFIDLAHNGKGEAFPASLIDDSKDAELEAIMRGAP